MANLAIADGKRYISLMKMCHGRNQLDKVQTDSITAIIELYKRDVDRTLIRENLKLTVEQRLRNLQN